MSEPLCPHCGQPHPREVALCPTTGLPVPGAQAQPGLPLPDGSLPPPAAEATSSSEPPPVPPPPPPQAAAGTETSSASASASAAATATAAGGADEKGVADILKEAYDMYRRHARALLVTCALVFVPASLVKSCALSVIMGPTVATSARIEEAKHAAGRDLEASNRQLQEAYQRNADAKTIEKLRAENEKRFAAIARRGMEAPGAAMGSFTLFMLERLADLVTALFYGLVVLLISGALTITLADRILGGSLGWRETWALLLRRLAPLLSAAIPASILVALGYLVFVIPGLVLGLLFAFIPPVTLIEGLRGRPAIQRSANLITADWLRVALLIAALGVASWLAHLLANLLIPASALFLTSLFGDLFTMVLLPVPVLAMVLLYFDTRRKHEGFTQDHLRAAMEALRR